MIFSALSIHESREHGGVFLDEILRVQMAESDAGFRELQQQHGDFDRMLTELMAKPYRSAEDDVEEALLKKKKLWLKDQMEARSANWLRHGAVPA